MCGQPHGHETRLVYKTSLGLGLETTRFVHSAGVGIIWLVSFPDLRPGAIYSLVPSLIPRPDKQSGNDLSTVLHGIPLLMSLTGGSPTTIYCGLIP